MPDGVTTYDDLGRGPLSHRELDQATVRQGKVYETPTHFYIPNAWGVGSVISGCSFSTTRCAGLVLQNSNTLVENCRVRNAKTGFRINALGTVYVNQEFAKYMDKGSVICDVASNSAYALPGAMIKAVKFAYKWADKDEDKFVNFFMKLAGKISDDYMSAGMAYSFSKNFVTWYAAKTAFDLGPRGIRVCSVSPGLIATDMGNAEVEHGGDLIKKNCEERMGTADELGYAIATAADPRNGYLAAVDVLVDGGSTRGNAEFKHDPLAPLKMAGIIK